MTDREDTVRKSDQIISRMIELWPLWLTLAGGVVTGVNFYNTVKDLSSNQKAWQASSEARRGGLQQEMEAVRTRLSVAENNIDWLKRRR